MCLDLKGTSGPKYTVSEYMGPWTLREVQQDKTLEA